MEKSIWPSSLRKLLNSHHLKVAIDEQKYRKKQLRWGINIRLSAFAKRSDEIWPKENPENKYPD